MFDLGQIIVHHEHGLCLIKDFKFVPVVQKNYFVMYPLQNQSMKIMVPEDNINNICRSLSSKEECLKILCAYKTLESDYIEDNKKRKEEGNKLLKNGDLLSLARLLKMLNKLFEDKKKINKTIGSIDYTMFNDAKSKFLQEIGYVFNIENIEEIEKFVNKKINS